VGAAAASAPRSGTPTAHHGIAVIDIKYILDRYNRLQADLKGWGAARDQVAADLQKQAEGFAKEVEKLKQLKPSTKEYKTLEEQLAKKDSDQKIQLQLREKEFAEKRASLYLAAYHDITAAVKAYADRNGISIVLQFNGAPVDQSNPQAVQAEVLKFVVYQNGIDITPIILDDLNRRVGAAGGVAQPPRTAPRR
jgi:Skp family chaperone for outer membrane proteins